jgi:hypothetical protein
MFGIERKGSIEKAHSDHEIWDRAVGNRKVTAMVGRRGGDPRDNVRVWATAHEEFSLFPDSGKTPEERADNDREREERAIERADRQFAAWWKTL